MKKHECPHCHQEVKVSSTNYTNKQIMNHIGISLKEFREEKSITQSTLAKLVGKSSPAYIAFIESGDRNVTATDLYKISYCLEKNISNFFPPEL